MPEKKSPTNKVINFIKSVILWLGGLMLWFLYAYNTLDRSKDAYDHTLGEGPMPSGYSIVLLAILLAFLLSKHFFSKKKNVASILVKVLVVIILLFGLESQLTYDPFLTKFRSYKEDVGQGFTGMELFDAVNAHRVSIGAQEIQLEQTFCDNLSERWLAVKNPEMTEELIDWWVKKGIVDDPYGAIYELYGPARRAEDLVESWSQAPDRKLPLENPDYNVGCTYADEGLGYLIIGEKLDEN